MKMMSTNLSVVSTFSVGASVVELFVVTLASVFTGVVPFGVAIFSAGSWCTYDGSSVESSSNPH